MVLFSSVTCTFSNTLKFVVKDCDPNTGEPDDEGYEDEYVVRVTLFCVACLLVFYFSHTSFCLCPLPFRFMSVLLLRAHEFIVI